MQVRFSFRTQWAPNECFMKHKKVFPEKAIKYSSMCTKFRKFKITDLYCLLISPVWPLGNKNKCFLC